MHHTLLWPLPLQKFIIWQRWNVKAVVTKSRWRREVWWWKVESPRSLHCTDYTDCTITVKFVHLLKINLRLSTVFNNLFTKGIPEEVRPWLIGTLGEGAGHLLRLVGDGAVRVDEVALLRPAAYPHPAAEENLYSLHYRLKGQRSGSTCSPQGPRPAPPAPPWSPRTCQARGTRGSSHLPHPARQQPPIIYWSETPRGEIIGKW